MNKLIPAFVAAALAFVAASAGLLSVSPPARADTAVTCTVISALPRVITAPGHYCLVGGLGFTPAAGQAGITINASNVVLDCNGHSLTQLGLAANTRGVFFGSRNDIEVRNCRIQDFFQGILGAGSNQRVFLVGNNVANARNIAVQLAVSNGGVIDNRIVDTTNAGAALYVTVGPNSVAAVNGNIIRNLTGPAAGMDGIWIYGTGRAEVRDNVISSIGTGTTTTAAGVRIGSTVASVPANIQGNHFYYPTAVKSYPVLKSAASAKSRCVGNYQVGTWQASTGCL